MALLKISDLSVGDWVMVNGRPRKISVLAEVWNGSNEVLVGYVVHVNSNGYNLVFYKPIEHVKPVPITAEILEKNGFTRGQRGDFFHYHRLDKNRTLYIHASTNGWRVEVTYDAAGILRTTHLMHDMNGVHDLQHALRLAGVDKEINL